MASIDNNTLKALGLDRSAQLRPVESARWEDSGTGYGFAAAEPVSFFARQENLITERLPLPSFEDATGGQVRRHRETGGVAYIDVPGARLTTTGVSCPAGERAILIDSRAQPAAVRVDLEWFTYVLLFERNEVEVRQLEQVAELFEDRPPVAAATPEFLFGDLEVEAWLRSEVAARAALPSSWSRATAAGLAARLWRTPRGGAASVDSLRREGSPASRAVAWFAGLPAIDREFLEHVAVQRAYALLTGIAVATRAAEGALTDAAETIRSLLVQRDDAECVRAILPLESRAVVSAALERADVAAVSQLSSLSAYAWPDDERLRAVLRREPDAWWGRFAEA